MGTIAVNLPPHQDDPYRGDSYRDYYYGSAAWPRAERLDHSWTELRSLPAIKRLTRGPRIPATLVIIAISQGKHWANHAIALSCPLVHL